MAWVREVVAATGPVAMTTVGRAVAADTLGPLVFGEDASTAGDVALVSSVGVHAGSWVACSTAVRVGSPTDELAPAPAIVTASADSGPFDNWIIPMIPVSMNVVMSHNCQRRARTPMRNSPK